MKNDGACSRCLECHVFMIHLWNVDCCIHDIEEGTVKYWSACRIRIVSWYYALYHSAQHDIDRRYEDCKYL